MGMKAVGAPVAATNVEYSESVSTWLRMHGKAVRPQLGKRQLGALRECFDIIDTDGTGKITAEELCNVFTVSTVVYITCFKLSWMTCCPTTATLQALGDHVSLEAGARVLDTTKHHGSDGIGFPDFISIMTKDSQDLESGPQQGKADVTIAYNIAIMARAYRQVRLFHLAAYLPATVLMVGLDVNFLPYLELAAYDLRSCASPAVAGRSANSYMLV